MSLFRIRWAISKLSDRKFRDRLRRQVVSPFAFYGAIALKLLPFSRRLELRLKDGKRVGIPTFMSLYIFSEIFVDGVYDGGFAAFPKFIIDIGANTGIFVLRAKQLCPDASVVAFEPEVGNYNELLRTVECNRLTNVSTIRAAIGVKPGPITLYRHPRNNGGHSTVSQVSGVAVTVPGATLTDAIGKVGGRVDLLKVDCEGAEEMILRGL